VSLGPPKHAAHDGGAGVSHPDSSNICAAVLPSHPGTGTLYTSAHTFCVAGTRNVVTATRSPAAWKSLAAAKKSSVFPPEQRRVHKLLGILVPFWLVFRSISHACSSPCPCTQRPVRDVLQAAALTMYMVHFAAKTLRIVASTTFQCEVETNRKGTRATSCRVSYRAAKRRHSKPF
jgi:hypothetical protein